MNNRTITVAVLLFVIVVIGMFTYAYLKRSEMESSAPAPMPEAPAEDRYAYLERIDAKHFFIDGTHTLVGEIMLPTPCDLLNWDTRIAESMPEQVTIDFSVLNNDTDLCAQVLTPARFSVTFDASEAASIGATLNSRALELNLIPPAPGETPEDFELFIKG
jgi:hypothetical protein